MVDKMNEIQEKINENNSRIDKGLWALSDWLKYNTESAWRNEHRLLSDHDYDYYQGIIKEARERLSED